MLILEKINNIPLFANLARLAITTIDDTLHLLSKGISATRRAVSWIRHNKIEALLIMMTSGLAGTGARQLISNHVKSPIVRRFAFWMTGGSVGVNLLRLTHASNENYASHQRESNLQKELKKSLLQNARDEANVESYEAKVEIYRESIKNNEIAIRQMQEESQQARNKRSFPAYAENLNGMFARPASRVRASNGENNAAIAGAGSSM